MTQLRHTHALLASFIALLLFSTAPRHACAQELTPRLGLGFNTLLSTSEGIGFGFTGRLSLPMNRDLSLAGSLTGPGFILRGRDDAVYGLEPRAAAIVTLPGSGDSAPYLLVGLGAYLPVSTPDDADDPANGPVLHAGYGRVHLLSETSFFWEINPGLVIQSTSVGLVVPFRIGVIF